MWWWWLVWCVCTLAAYLANFARAAIKLSQNLLGNEGIDAVSKQVKLTPKSLLCTFGQMSTSMDRICFAAWGMSQYSVYMLDNTDNNVELSSDSMSFSIGIVILSIVAYFTACTLFSNDPQISTIVSEFCRTIVTLCFPVLLNSWSQSSITFIGFTLALSFSIIATTSAKTPISI